jgi:RNA polymerase sigma factor (sigma-70 family)
MKGSTNGVIHRVRHLVVRADRSTDAELMARFIADRDADAFALLVRRHGPMVHGVCRRVLRNGADADDAFQATFLLLARRARSIQRPRLLGNWLYGVAYRTALEARRAAAVRKARERRAAEMKHSSAREPSAATPDLAEILDRELAALPDVYRTAVVLCDLEGLSRKDAAERLGWSEGTLSGRLFRARSLLAARLARLGLAVPAAGLGVAATASAAVPSALTESTIRIGTLIAAGEAVAIAAAPVAALTEGVMKAMLLTKLKGLATVVVVSCAVLATSVAGWRANAVGASAATVVDGQTPGEPARRTAQRDPDKDRIAQLERERDELLKVVRNLEARLEKLEGNQKGEARARVAEEKERAALEARRANEMKLRGLPKALEGKVPPEVLDKLKTLELEFDGKSADKKAAIEDLLQKLKAVEFDSAKLAKLKEFKETDLADKLKAMQLAAETAAKLKAREDTRSGRAKDLSGDRVGALEDRVKSMEADLKKLLVELERQRRK